MNYPYDVRKKYFLIDTIMMTISQINYKINTLEHCQFCKSIPILNYDIRGCPIVVLRGLVRLDTTLPCLTDSNVRRGSYHAPLRAERIASTPNAIYLAKFYSGDWLVLTIKKSSTFHVNGSALMRILKILF